MSDWIMMTKRTLKITQAAIKVQIALMKRIFSQQKEKTKMRGIRAKIGQEKEKCLQLLQRGFFAKGMNFKKT
jgi:hypothetical protein